MADGKEKEESSASRLKAARSYLEKREKEDEEMRASGRTSFAKKPHPGLEMIADSGDKASPTEGQSSPSSRHTPTPQPDGSWHVGENPSEGASVLPQLYIGPSAADLNPVATAKKSGAAAPPSGAGSDRTSKIFLPKHTFKKSASAAPPFTGSHALKRTSKQSVEVALPFSGAGFKRSSTDVQTFLASSQSATTSGAPVHDVSSNDPALEELISKRKKSYEASIGSILYLLHIDKIMEDKLARQIRYHEKMEKVTLDVKDAQASKDKDPRLLKGLLEKQLRTDEKMKKADLDAESVKPRRVLLLKELSQKEDAYLFAKCELDRALKLRLPQEELPPEEKKRQLEDLRSNWRDCQ